MTDWTDEELEASIIAYREMERFEADGKPYAKTEFYRDLTERFGRTTKAFEYRMQNISAILDQRGEPWLQGLKPAGNVGAKVAPRIESLLVKHPTGKTSPQPDYVAKLPAIREWLIRVARRGVPVTYGDLNNAFGLHRFNAPHALGKLGRQAFELGEPIISAMVVSKTTGRCGAGFSAEFGVDDAVERGKLHKYWLERTPTTSASLPADSSVERMARFVSREARPDQAAFRRKVFEACGERCVISGCNVVEVLDAAHKKGLDWRKHNKAEDGYLMRKDLHALYDNDLLTIKANGTITLHESVVAEYGQFSGKKIGC
jgi:hypothetical protein